MLKISNKVSIMRIVNNNKKTTKLSTKVNPPANKIKIKVNGGN